MDEKSRQVNLTERGLVRLKNCWLKKASWMKGSLCTLGQHHADAPRNGGAARSCAVYRDVDYIVKDGEVIIVDEHTVVPCRAVAGPMVCTRQWKRKRCADPERKPNAGFDHLPELLRLYEKLAGMTGTADTEAFESAPSISWILSLFRPTVQ